VTLVRTLEMKSLCRARAALLAVLMTAGMSLPSPAQTVAPVIARFVEQGRGELSVENPTADPMPVSLSVRGFTVDSTGAVHFHDVPEGTRVELAYRSFTLPPRSRTVVPYRVRTSNAPTWVVIEASFIPPRRGSVQTRIVLPHVVYVRQRATLDVADLSALISPAGNGWALRLENSGTALDRLEGASWHAADGRRLGELSPAVPVLPHATRHLQLGVAPPGAHSLRINGEFGSLDVPLPPVLTSSVKPD